jgi:glycosyltransferase involved in cell wall biosynthesis
MLRSGPLADVFNAWGGKQKMRVAMIGTRGVPARYGGFETAIEEIGQRLVARGHEVVVYCRGAEDPNQRTHLGMELVHLPAARRKTLETLSHTALSVAHLVSRDRVDGAIVFNAANAPFVPALRARRIPVAVHVDGLEWKRSKWQGAGRRYYRAVEAMAVRMADALIADARGISDYYADEFGAQTELLAYGAPVQDEPGSDRIEELGLRPDDYHLVVARFEPENHVLEIVEGYHRSDAELPLVVVGSAPYADDYTADIARVAKADPRIRLLGGVWDQEQLDQLYANALTYLHGHSVGGTNPSLLRAMGAGTAVLAFDVVFNREVVGVEGEYFHSADDVAEVVRKAELSSGEMLLKGWALRERARQRYCWDDVAAGYEELLQRLGNGFSTRGRSSGRRRPLDAQVSWARPSPAFDPMPGSVSEPRTQGLLAGGAMPGASDVGRQRQGDFPGVPEDSIGGVVGGVHGAPSREHKM